MGGRCRFKGQTHSGGEQERKRQWALRLSRHTRRQTPVWNPYATKTAFRSQSCQRAARRYEAQQVSLLSSALSQSLDRTHTHWTNQKTLDRNISICLLRRRINSKLINITDPEWDVSSGGRRSKVFREEAVKGFLRFCSWRCGTHTLVVLLQHTIHWT